MRRAAEALLVVALVLSAPSVAHGQAKESHSNLFVRAVRTALAEVFVTIGPSLAGPLGYVVGSHSPVIGDAAVIALGEIGDDRYAYRLKSAFEYLSVERRILVCRALVRLDDRLAPHFLLSASKHDWSPDVRSAAARALDDISARIGEDSLVFTLTHDGVGWLANDAAIALANVGTDRALAAVESWLHDPRSYLGDYGTVSSLADLEQPTAVRLLSGLTRDTMPHLRRLAYDVLAKVDSVNGFVWLSRALFDPDSVVRRAAVTAFGTAVDSATESLLVAATRDRAPIVRAAAVERLVRRPDARQVVVTAMTDTSTRVRGAAVRVLLSDTSSAATSVLTIALQDSDASVRASVLSGSARLTPRRFDLSQLTARLADSSQKVRLAAIEALSHRGDTGAVVPLTRVLVDTPRAVRLRAVEALGHLADPRAAPALLPMLHAPDPEARVGAIWALGMTGGRGVAEALHKVLREGVGDEQWWAAARLGRLQYAPAVDPLMDLLGDSFSRVRMVAAWALGRIGDASAADALGRAVRDKDPASSDAAALALIQLGEPGIRVLVHLLRDSADDVRRAAARGFASAKLPVADSVLLDAAERKDLVVVAEAYRFYLGLDNPVLDRTLAVAMGKHGTTAMALEFGHSGRPVLRDAVRRWSRTHGLRVGGNDVGFAVEYDWQNFDYRN